MITPPLDATARFGFVTIENRTESPLLRHVRDFIEKELNERPNELEQKKRKKPANKGGQNS